MSLTSSTFAVVFERKRVSYKNDFFEKTRNLIQKRRKIIMMFEIVFSYRGLKFEKLAVHIFALPCISIWIIKDTGCWKCLGFLLQLCSWFFWSIMQHSTHLKQNLNIMLADFWFVSMNVIQSSPKAIYESVTEVRINECNDYWFIQSFLFKTGFVGGKFVLALPNLIYDILLTRNRKKSTNVRSINDLY